MTRETPPLLPPALLRDVSEYLERHADELHRTHAAPPDGRIGEPTIRDEVQRVRRWAQKLRRAALMELSK